MFTYPVGFFNPKVGGFDRSKLLGEWLFNNNFLDTSGNNITLSEDGTVDFGTNRHSVANSCIEIVDGIAGTLYSRNAFDLGSFNNWAFSGWVFLGPNFGNNRGLWGGGDIDQTLLKSFFIKVFSGKFQLSGIDSGITAPLSTWIHLAVNADVIGSTVDVYKNGFFITQLAISTPSNPSEITIGNAVKLTSAGYWRGKLDDFRFFNDLLTTEEITFLANE